MAKRFHKISFFSIFSMSYNYVDQRTTNTLFQHQKQNQSFADVLQNEFYQKFPKIHKKTPMPESFFQKILCIQARFLLQ